MKKTELSRTSPKRAKLIKEGLKTNGTYTKPKPKAMKRSKLKSKRKPTGEAALFRTLWENLPHECEVCKVYIHEATAGNFSHLLNKGTYPEFRLDPRNVVLKCSSCHDLWHQHGAGGLRWSFPWQGVIAIYDELRAETIKPRA